MAWKEQALRAFCSATSSASAGEFSLDDSKRLCILILEKALKQLPEGQDTVLGVFDLKGFKQKNGDLGFAGFLVSMLTFLLCWKAAVYKLLRVLMLIDSYMWQRVTCQLSSAENVSALATVRHKNDAYAY